jgi:hypothetical protein
MKKEAVKLGCVAALMLMLIGAIRVTNDENWVGVWFLLLLFVGLPLSLLSLRDLLLSFAATRTESRKFWLMLHVCALFAAGIGYGLGVMAESSGNPKADVQKWLVVALPCLVYITPVLLALHSAPVQLLSTLWMAIRGKRHE